MDRQLCLDKAALQQLDEATKLTFAGCSMRFEPLDKGLNILLCAR